ncbi:MAG TPA: Rrf2 family transcriptional regulator [Candidatus Omnitrophota bacterium]|nr:Rrf2 family transcriptional regulator [Candidatus Omnitrophota bacterium]
MKLITRETDYAVRALAYIAGQKKEVVPVSELVKELTIPRAFLRKLLQILNRKGILKSYKGNGGGFALAKRAREIFLVDLIKIFQGPLQVSECLFKRDICPDISTCLLKNKLGRIERRVVSELKSINLASLLN